MIYLDDGMSGDYVEGAPDGGCPACGVIWGLLITFAVVGVILGYLHT